MQTKVYNLQGNEVEQIELADLLDYSDYIEEVK